MTQCNALIDFSPSILPASAAGGTPIDSWFNIGWAQWWATGKKIRLIKSRKTLFV